jgi:hypothetical protein
MIRPPWQQVESDSIDAQQVSGPNGQSEILELQSYSFSCPIIPLLLIDAPFQSGDSKIMLYTLHMIVPFKKCGDWLSEKPSLHVAVRNGDLDGGRRFRAYTQ